MSYSVVIYEICWSWLARLLYVAGVDTKYTFCNSHRSQCISFWKINTLKFVSSPLQRTFLCDKLRPITNYSVTVWSNDLPRIGLWRHVMNGPTPACTHYRPIDQLRAAHLRRCGNDDGNDADMWKSPCLVESAAGLFRNAISLPEICVKRLFGTDLSATECLARQDHSS